MRLSAALSVMAWREILARIFDGFERRENVSPPWLVNPSTRRRLKLDVLYPEIGIAIRFVGLRGKNRRALSDWELLEEEQRDQVRAELCRLNGVTLVLIPVMSDQPGKPLRDLSAALGQASRRIGRGRKSPKTHRLRLMLGQARRRCEAIIQRVGRPEDLVSYAELWRDREAALVTALQADEPNPKPPPRRRLPLYAEGMAVTHVAFGAGTIVAITPEGDDQRITVRFDTAGERTFLASLVTDKLMPA
ncbi:MAG: hypothetical protein J7M34_11980 [Anaerolineae bacterium]|nr:hypothetical protein [Anaerolineae bacterium]